MSLDEREWLAALDADALAPLAGEPLLDALVARAASAAVRSVARASAALLEPHSPVAAVATATEPTPPPRP